MALLEQFPPPHLHSLVSPQQQGFLPPHPSLPPIIFGAAFTKVTRELPKGHLFGPCLTCSPVVFDTSDSFPSGMPMLGPHDSTFSWFGSGDLSQCLDICPSPGFHLSPMVRVLHGGLFHPLNAAPQAHVYMSHTSAALPGCPLDTRVSLVRREP